MDLQGVWLTLGAAVNRRFWAGMRHDLQKGPPNSTPSTAFGPQADWQQRTLGFNRWMQQIG